MFFKSALAALISFSLVVVPAAASAQAYYLGEKNVPDDMPRPKDHPPEAGMKWRCDKNPETGKWNIFCAGWVWKDVPEPKVVQVASAPVTSTPGLTCHPELDSCELPANLHPRYPAGNMFKLVNPACAPGDPATKCKWYNSQMMTAAQAQVQFAAAQQPAPAPKPEKEPKRYGTGTMLAVGLLGLVAGAALGANGGRGGYYNGNCYCYTSYMDSGSAYNAYRRR